MNTGKHLSNGAVNFRRVVLLFGLTTVIVACSDTGSNGNATTRPAIDAPRFSADSAFAFLKRQVEFGPRVPGTPGHAQQLEWMTGLLRSWADTVELQAFTHDAEGTRLDLTNVFARFRPTATDRILLVAHWDTRPTADGESDSERRAMPIPGANDGASGTAVLLELARALSQQDPPIGVDLLFVDGEDYGPFGDNMYLGAKYFAANLPAGYKPLYGIVIDMVGDENPVYQIEGNSESSAPEIVQRVWRLAEQMGHGGVFQSRSGITVEDDHVPLNRAGIRTIDIIDFDYGPGNSYWHTLEDDIDNTSPRGLGIVGEVMVALIYRGG
ncbi:MAG: M28 family peptidase [Longimicrobiales bacterium]